MGMRGRACQTGRAVGVSVSAKGRLCFVMFVLAVSVNIVTISLTSQLLALAKVQHELCGVVGV